MGQQEQSLLRRDAPVPRSHFKYPCHRRHLAAVCALQWNGSGVAKHPRAVGGRSALGMC